MHPNKFLLKRIYGLEEVVWKIPRRLLRAWSSFVSKWNERSIYEYRFALKHPIKFLLMRTYGLEEDVVWQISRLLFSSWPSWYLNLIWASMFAWFLLKRTYGFEEAIAWRIPRWLFNAWPSLISKWNDLSNSDSPFCLSFCSKGYMVWKKILFEVLKTAAMVAQHNDSAGCESRIPSLMPYKLSNCSLQTCRWFHEFWTVKKVTLPHSVFQTCTQPNLSLLIGIIPHVSTLKHYFAEK